MSRPAPARTALRTPNGNTNHYDNTITTQQHYSGYDESSEANGGVVGAEEHIQDKGQKRPSRPEENNENHENGHEDIENAGPEEEQEEEEEIGEEDEEEEEEEEEEVVVDEHTAEDMRKLENNFKGITKRYRLINRIGEGTFSTVYKAELLAREDHDPKSELDNHAMKADATHTNPAKRRRVGDTGVSKSIHSHHPTKSKKPKYVALKKIYVTSSPVRIQNELELLAELREYKSICPLLCAFRHQDQVVAVLPFFPHTDFRYLYRTFLVNDMRFYFKSMLEGLHAVHKTGIIHRDIKPTNFLYNPDLRHGVLVDFGLAERAYLSADVCPCVKRENNPAYLAKMMSSQAHSTGYPKNDTRPSKRANRAGTRGFRAPEVLFKCTSQTTKIDMWSAGVILLTFLGRRFPFFNSMDDVEAMIEIASIFGFKRMKTAALLHGQVFESNIPTIGERGYSWEKIVLWSSCVDKLTASEKQAVDFLSCLMELDPAKRWSAKSALTHPFFTKPETEDLPWGGDNWEATHSNDAQTDQDPDGEAGKEEEAKMIKNHIANYDGKEDYEPETEKDDGVHMV